MDKAIQDALEAEGRRQGAIDADVIRCFPKITDPLKVLAGKVDPDAVADAVASMAKTVPALFRKPKPWNELTADQFASRERSMRETIAAPVDTGSNEFGTLDAARLSDEELHALDRCVGGQSNGFDRGVLSRALARQQSENAALAGATS
jgi:hypothetical protein